MVVCICSFLESGTVDMYIILSSSELEYTFIVQLINIPGCNVYVQVVLDAIDGAHYSLLFSDSVNIENVDIFCFKVTYNGIDD